MRYPILGAVLVLAACGKEKAATPAADVPGAAPGAPAAAPAAPTATPAGGATITGTVKFSGTPPANPTIDMSEESVCQAKYTSPPTDPQVVVTGGIFSRGSRVVPRSLGSTPPVDRRPDPASVPRAG